MNRRERFVETLTFGKPDRIPLSPGGPRESTLKRWQSEGLPPDRHYMDYLREILGIEKEEPGPEISPGVDFRMIPQFEEKVLEHRDGHYIVRDWMGAITEISDEFDYTYIRRARDFVTRKWHKFPVENRADWAEMKERYRADTPGRFPPDFAERARLLRERDYPLYISFNGPFWQAREWLGFENLCLMTVEDPDFLAEMTDFWRGFVSRMLDMILEKIVPDCVRFQEDMAYKAKSMISPAMSRQLLLPAWQEWAEKARHAGCPLVDIDSDGYIGELIPLWIEAGVNVCDPVEIAAGNDLPAYRRQFGRRMAYRGGIDKRAIAAGGERMRQAVLGVTGPLFEEGGFIPGCDHGVPPDISWPDFVEYTRLLAGLTGWLNGK